MVIIITIIARTINRLMESLFISVYRMERPALFRKVIQTATGKYTALLFNLLLLLFHLQGPVQLFLKQCPSYNRIIMPPVLPSPWRKLFLFYLDQDYCVLSALGCRVWVASFQTT